MGELFGFSQERFVDFCEYELALPRRQRYAWGYFENRKNRINDIDAKNYDLYYPGNDWLEYWQAGENDPGKIAAKLNDSLLSGITFGHHSKIGNPYCGEPKFDETIYECFVEFLEIPHHAFIDNELNSASFKMKRIDLLAEAGRLQSHWHEYFGEMNHQASLKFNEMIRMNQKLRKVTGAQEFNEELIETAHNKFMNVRSSFPVFTPSEEFLNSLSSNPDVSFSTQLFANEFAINRIKKTLLLKKARAFRED